MVKMDIPKYLSPYWKNILTLDHWRIFRIPPSRRKGECYCLQYREDSRRNWVDLVQEAQIGTKVVGAADTREEMVILLAEKLRKNGASTSTVVPLLDQNMRCDRTHAETILLLDYWRIFRTRTSFFLANEHETEKYYLQRRSKKSRSWLNGWGRGRANEGAEIVAVADTAQEAIILLAGKLNREEK